MNIEHKKTALDDDSMIYQKRDDSFGKKDISNLSGKQKLQYFKDYYLLKVVVALAALIALGTLANGMFFNRSECVLAVAFLNGSQIIQPEELNDAITEYLQPEGRNDYISVENYGLDDYQMQMAYVTKMSAGAIDLTVCPRDYFEQGCALGMFAGLDEFLPQEKYQEVEGRILEGREAETDEEGNPVSYHEAKPYGIDISGSTHFAEFGGIEEDSVLCVMRNTQQAENVQKVIDYFLE